MLEKQKILVISHAHPKISKGGGENAAYNLFKEIQQRDNCEVIFLAYNPLSSLNNLGTCLKIYALDGSEIILSGGSPDHFIFSQLNTILIWKNFRDLLDCFQPTIVHFHHYIHVGLEMIREVRKYSKNVPIIMTLHEYLAICNNDGKMVKISTHKLCDQAIPADCHKCFPNKSPEDFQLRELYIKSFFNLIDIFIAPSKFLLNRYVTWGIPQEKIVHLDNGLSLNEPASPRTLAFQESRTKFAYFGTLSIFKGILVVFEALERLPKEIRRTITLDIYGANLEFQSQDFQNKFSELIEKTIDCVRFHGPYQSEEMPKLMNNIDWVIVPSIWWENSPLVIEEALFHKRPVICSNIGGMAEKVEHEQSGLHFKVGDASSLAECIARAATEEGLWDKLSNGISERLTIQEVANQTLEIYGQIQEKRSVSNSQNC
jgi:glycosyltransferase involved in cell wall biosynthesis